MLWYHGARCNLEKQIWLPGFQHGRGISLLSDGPGKKCTAPLRPSQAHSEPPPDVRVNCNKIRSHSTSPSRSPSKTWAHRKTEELPQPNLATSSWLFSFSDFSCCRWSRAPLFWHSVLNGVGGWVALSRLVSECPFISTHDASQHSTEPNFQANRASTDVLTASEAQAAGLTV